MKPKLFLISFSFVEILFECLNSSNKWNSFLRMKCTNNRTDHPVASYFCCHSLALLDFQIYMINVHEYYDFPINPAFFHLFIQPSIQRTILMIRNFLFTKYAENLQIFSKINLKIHNKFVVTGIL